ncbi:nucleotidyltransferase family protein [Pseudocolwellia agarivorans]|uniref:nucleotidyltransferase family protein n=1 Tax=Pseudocolwellia agarivorans TaxID=1911682 RepID=UPI00098747F4|nr:nucleotidyltransferase family protein [Pseudocolwellia agarivorans]
MFEPKSNTEALLINQLAKLVSTNLVNLNSIAVKKDSDKTQVEQLYSLCITHGVANQINTNLSALLSQESNTTISTKDIAPLKELNSKLTAFAQHSRVISTITDNAAKELLYELAQKNIKVVVLKGFSLGYQVYDTPYLRPKTDVDILIRNEDKVKVSEIFKHLGYSNPRGWEPQAIMNQFAMKKTLSKGVNVLFDVHLKISNSKQIENILNYQELIQSSNTTLLPNINLINKPYALIHAIFHLLHHKSSGDLIKLIWYYDLYLIIEQLDSAEIEQLKTIITNTGLAFLVQHTLVLTIEYFPSVQINNLIQWCETPSINATSEKSYNYLLGNVFGVKGLWLSLCATKGLTNKVAIIRETAFPPAAEIYIKYGKDSGWPLSLLYIRRIFTGSIKYIFKRKK